MLSKTAQVGVCKHLREADGGSRDAITQGDLNMTWGKPHKEKKSKAQSQMGESEIKAKLDALKATIQRAFDSRSRFWFYNLLACAYALYDEWRAVRHSKKNAKKAARSFGLKIKDGAHPLTAIIKVLTPTGVDARRWTDGLRFARKKGVAPKDLTAFLKANGGIAGCARQFHAQG
jgi:hypothetical protein